MDMDQEKLKVIKELMDELVGEMEPSAEDFDMRLGKPKVDVLAIKGEGEAMDGDDDVAMEGDFLPPEEKLKERILKLRG